MHIVTKISAGSFSGAITSNKELIIWGSGDFGILSTPQKIFIDDVKFKDVQICKQAEGFAAAIDEN
jgi:hypothetical protein